MKLELRAVGLAIIGCILGASGAMLYLMRSPLYRALGDASHRSGTTVSLAQCSDQATQDQTDEIFFVSCGGIY